jgi:diketogulonate reductase-like aldo/keto reductase
MGYRHLDTAQLYDNEESVGKGIAAADVDREDVFLTTKVWRSNLRHDDVIESVSESLDRLDVDYIDLLLVHWPHPRVPLEETLSAMAELREENLVAHLGVSNFTPAQLREARRIADTPIVADQVLYHPYYDQTNLVTTCQENNVALTAYSPLARGSVLSDDVLVDIGKHYDKSPAQVALRWLVQQESVVAIPKASSREHLKANLDVFDFALSEEEMARIGGRRPDIKTRLYNLMPRVGRRIPI